MTPERWSHIAAIVDSALMQSEQARASFLAEACGDDADLRREVDSLLAQAPDADAFLSKPAADLVAGIEERSLVGERIGPYSIEGSLGVGGMGEVYRAHDTNLDRDVAIKVLPRVFTADAERVARFEREARILAALNHPRVGAIYGLEHADGLPALILELVEGPTLAERLARGRLAIDETVQIAIAIAEGLDAAHDRGIIHRDIKPANVKITPGGVKVLDFGLAKDVQCHDLDSSASAETTARLDLSSAGAVLGTVAYMSPEQARGEAIDPRTDLFSLGAVLYEMVTGRRAFGGDEASRVIEAILHDTPAPPRRLNPEVPRALERVILRLLAPQREARYQTAAAVRDDLMRVATDIGPSDEPNRARLRRRTTLAIAAAVAAAIAVLISVRRVDRAPARREYAQVTHFPDSATSPALSPDGRLLTFIRGESTFEGPGQIYLKELPDGEPVQLTSDRLEKMSPVFSPDGSRIAYTTLSDAFVWDTWVVTLADRTPRRWLANASGLSWMADRRLLFSEVTSGFHMRVVSASDRRDGVRVLYSPESDRGMAHRSYPSPDGAWLLVAEMVQPVWQPCRLVTVDGRTSHRAGPDGQCTSAAWSPDGKWMYFSSNASGSFHIWRQRFPDGAPEQLSFGPGEEEGIALSPDGRSILTSVGNRQSSIWVRDGSGEREISKEGYAFIPQMPSSSMSQPFSVNGRLLYLVRQGPVRFAGLGERIGELWQTNLDSSQSEPLFPGVRVSGYDVSRDGSQIAFAALDDRGVSHIWLGRMDRRDAPRQLSTREADSPRFGAGGKVYFRAPEGGASFIYQMTPGGESTRVVARPVLFLQSVSPDDAWVVARVEAAPRSDSSQENLAFPTASDRPPVRLCDASCEVDWTPNARSLVLRWGNRGSPSLVRTVIVALRPGETLPRFPADGIRSEADLSRLAAARIVDGAVFPDDARIAFVRSTTERNIYRISLP